MTSLVVSAQGIVPNSQGKLFDPDFNPDMDLTVSNMVSCAPHVIDGLPCCAAAPGAMQGEAP